MTDHAWKKFERRVSVLFGLVRRGAHTSDSKAGKSDACEADGSESRIWSLEMKLHRNLNYQTILDACKQAEAAAVHDSQEPVAIVKQPNRRDGDALVVQRLSVFREWRLPIQNDEKSPPDREAEGAGV